MAYLTFHRILIPIGSYSIPLQFFNTGNFFASSIANVTLDHWIPELNKHPGLAYSVSLKLELFCNRNRADDLFRFPSTFRIDGTDVIKTSNFIMNCDSRSIYRHNNIVVPYNLRFWVSPVLSNLNKNVNVEFEYLKMTGMELVKHLKEHVVHVSIEGHVIVNDDNTFLELTVQRDGFRYYLQKYPIQSFVYGVLIFWSFSVFFSLVIAFGLFASDDSTSKRKKRFESKTQFNHETLSKEDAAFVLNERQWLQNYQLSAVKSEESKDVAEGESVSIKEEP
ncbi:hypothetical protein CANTEDRAFT_115544, partial [Yamadazyma tenuis ATCC 10573]